MTPQQPTAETLFFTNAAGRVYYCPDGYVRLEWSAQVVTLDTIQAYYEQVLALLRRQNCRFLLSEHAQRAPLTPAMQTWLTDNWIPRAMQQARVQYCAVIDGQNPIHRLATQTVISTAPTGFTFKRFADRAAAAAWLRTLY